MPLQKPIIWSFCKYCASKDKNVRHPVVFLRRSSLLEKFIKEVHENKRSKLKPYCAVCQKRFKSISGHACHVTFVQQIKNTEEWTLRTNFKDSQCEICKKTFLSGPNYVRLHKRNVHGLTPHYTCDICYNEFDSPSQVHHHMLFHKNKENPYKCDICYFTFGHHAVLELHIKREHCYS